MRPASLLRTSFNCRSNSECTRRSRHPQPLPLRRHAERWPGVEDDSGLDGWYERDWGYDSPVLLIDTGSLNAWVTSVNNAGRTSRLNCLSATACVDIAEMLLLTERVKPNSGQARILIGAPYRPQAKLINLLIREQKLDPDVPRGTAHTFQGSEAPGEIFDLVNDEPHWKVAMFILTSARTSDGF